MLITATARLVLLTTTAWRAPHNGVRCLAAAAGKGGDAANSVSGVVYSGPEDAPTVKLYTKAGCTLCDVAKEVLQKASEERPHTLEAVDITDEANSAWWGKYKYDIPVLHVDGKYWAKHRISLEDSLEALKQASDDEFEARKGEPDAERLERGPRINK